MLLTWSWLIFVLRTAFIADGRNLSLSAILFPKTTKSTVDCRWPWPLSCVHSGILVFSAWLAEGWGASLPPFFHPIYHHLQSCSVRSSWEGSYTPPISPLPLYVFCASVCLWLFKIWPFFPLNVFAAVFLSSPHPCCCCQHAPPLFSSWGRILGRNWDKSRQSFPPGYSQSPIRNLGLYFYSTPSSRDVARSWLRIMARGGPNSTRGSKELEPLLRAKEQGARTSEGCVRNASRRGHHYVGAWPGPPTSSA